VDRSRCGGALGRLQDQGAAGSDGADTGAKAKLDREVVGSDDEADSQGFLPNAMLHHEVGGVHVGDTLLLDPFLEVLDGVPEILEDEVDLAEVGFKCGLAQVTVEGFDELGLEVNDAPVQFSKLPQSVLDILGLVRPESGAEAIDDTRDGFHGSVGEFSNINFGRGHGEGLGINEGWMKRKRRRIAEVTKRIYDVRVAFA